MSDIRKIVVIFVIAVLFSIFVFSTIDAIYPQPNYNQYCDSHYSPYPRQVQSNISCPEFIVPETEFNECRDQGGHISYTYDQYGCITTYTCDTCNSEYNKAREQHNMVRFIIASLLGLIAIIVSLYLPAKKNELHEWVGTGFMLGGLFTLFFGTMVYFSDMSRFLRPVVILAELLIILFISYRKLGNKITKESDDPKKVKPTTKNKTR